MSDIADVANIPDRTFVSFEVITAQGANHVFRMMEGRKEIAARREEMI